MPIVNAAIAYFSILGVGWRKTRWHEAPQCKLPTPRNPKVFVEGYSCGVGAGVTVTAATRRLPT
jgi:hypothetical protein